MVPIIQGKLRKYLGGGERSREAGNRTGGRKEGRKGGSEEREGKARETPEATPWAPPPTPDPGLPGPHPLGDLGPPLGSASFFLT